MGVEAMGKKRAGESGLRRLLIYYDPLQGVALELQRIADSLERLEMLGEAGIQVTMMLRRIEEQLDRLNALMERICAILEEGGRSSKRRGRDANSQERSEG
jgi:hypothetical protein